MSMRTTSGRNRAVWRTASSPSIASPVTSRSGSNSRILRRPTRTSGWSSAISTAVMAGSPGRQQDAEPEPAVLHRSRLELPAGQGAPLPDADQPLPAAGDVARRAGPVVGDLELEASRTVPDTDVDLPAPGVLERVGESLLHDPVGGHLDPAGKTGASPAHCQLPRKAGAPQPRHECGNRREAGLRCEL